MKDGRRTEGLTLKGQFTSTFSPTFSAFYPSRLFWCEMHSSGDICHRDVCLVLYVVKLDVSGLVMLKAPNSDVIVCVCGFVISCFILKFCPHVWCFAFHFLHLCDFLPSFCVRLCPLR